MRFIVSSLRLLKKLKTLGGVISSNNSMPILDNFLFDFSDQKLLVSATDLETTVKSVVDVEFTNSGSIAIQAKLLLEMLSQFPDQPLTFNIKDNNFLEISSSQGNYSLVYSNPEEFPKAITFPKARKISLKGDVLASAISNTLFAAGNDDMRPAMNGVFFRFSDSNFRFVATDAHKLAVYKRTDLSASEQGEFIMPRKALTLLKNMYESTNDEVEVEYNENNVRFSYQDTELMCRLVDGKYPNYEAVIPKENPNVLIINREILLTSIRRVSLFSSKITHQVRLKIAGTELRISAEDTDFSNSAEERLVCQYQGDDLEIGFNARFFTEMLGLLNSEEVQLEMSLPNKAGILSPIDGTEEGEQIQMLMMPVIIG